MPAVHRSTGSYRKESVTPRSYLKIVVVGSLLFFVIYTAALRSLLGSGEDPLKTLVHPVLKLVNRTKIYESYLIYGEKCHIRKYDHNDPEIHRQYFMDPVPDCPPDAKPFVFRPEIDSAAGRSCIGVDNAVARQSYGDSVGKWNCTYKEAIRDTNQRIIDKHFYFGEKKPLRMNDCPIEEFIWIECKRPGNGRLYEQPLFLPVVKSVRSSIRPNNRGRKPLNVLLLGLDAVSRMNAHRQLPKTIEFLKSKSTFVELFGFNKIEDNSNPNQVPILTGIPFAAPGLRSRVDDYYDNVTRYIWEDFEDRGYRTMFFEELTKFGIFNHPSSLFKGFAEVPTTYWPRPLIQAIEKSELKADGNGWCIGPDMPAKHLLDYTYHTMKILGEDRPLFSYSWLVEASHDFVNGAYRDDRHFLEFFKKMDSSGILANTAVFFVSDHGVRIGDFRKSTLGRYEDMLPFGFVLMPESYFEGHPHALTNLQANSRRLVTVYDIHATLRELMDPWSEGRITKTANGYSLLSNVIPSDRDCKDAGINFQFCSCYEHHPYSAETEVSQAFTKFVVDRINSIIKESHGPGVCHELVLDTVENFVRLSEVGEWTQYYKATVQTKPFAQFEVSAEFVPSTQSWVLRPDIVRIDWFSTTSKCVEGANMEQLCRCK